MKNENSYFNGKKLILSCVYIVIGATLLGLSIAEIITSDMWSGIGGGLIGVGIMQLVRNLRYRNDSEYKQKIDIAANDERNSYIRMKSFSYTGYIFILGACVLSLVLLIMGYKESSQILGLCVCFELIVYYVSYFILSRKY